MASRSTLKTQAGAQIRALRIARKWSLRKLGEEVGLTRQGVYRIEAGEVAMPLDTLERFALALCVPPAALVGGDGVPGFARRSSQKPTQNRS